MLGLFRRVGDDEGLLGHVGGEVQCPEQDRDLSAVQTQQDNLGEAEER